MIQVTKSRLKAKMLEYFRQVEQTGEELVVLNNKTPTLRIVPFKRKGNVEEIFQDLRGKIEIQDSIMEPESDEWEEIS